MALETAILRAQRVYVDSASPTVPLSGRSALITGTAGEMTADSAWAVYTAGVDRAATNGLDLYTEVTTNTSNIVTNAGNISTNTSNISTNTGNISTNTTNISANTSSIATNTGNISTNTANISTNAAAISTLQTNDSTQDANIATLQSQVATAGVDDAATNTYDLYANSLTNAGNISTNAANIATNAGNIDTNTTNIASNTTAIGVNSGKIAVNETDILARTRWRGSWTTTTYELNDQALDEGWLGIANKQTTDRLAPQPIGAPHWESGLGDDPPWSSQSDTADVVIWGARYTPDRAKQILRGRVWIPEVNPLVSYDAYIVDNPLTAPVYTQVPLPTPTEVGWINVNGSGEITGAGDVFDLLVVARSTSGEDTWSGYWDLKHDDSAPSSGEMNWYDNQYRVRIHYTDKNDDTWTTELQALKVGDKMSVAGIEYTILDITQQGSDLDIEVSPSTRPSEAEYTVLFTTAVPTPILSVNVPGQYAGNPEVAGLFASDTAPAEITPDDNAYGVDLETQDLSVSDDWDLQASTSSASGGGNGGSQPNVTATYTAAEDVGFAQGEAAASANVQAWNNLFANTNKSQHTTTYFRHGDWWFNDTCDTSRSDNGSRVIGDCGIGGNYRESDFGDGGDERTGPWGGGALTRFNWSGPVGAASGGPMFNVRSRGFTFENIYFQGAPSAAGAGDLPTHRAKDPLVSGPLTGVLINDDFQSHGTGANVLRNCTIAYCQAGVQLGTRGSIRIQGDTGFANSTVQVTEHRLYTDAVIDFENFGGGLPSPLLFDTDYYVVNPTANSFQLASEPGGAPITFGAGTAGRIDILRSSQYSNADQFTADGFFTTDRCWRGVVVLNGNAISNVIHSYYQNHTRYGISIRNGDMHVVEWDVNGLLANQTDVCLVHIWGDTNFGYGSQSINTFVDRVRLDGGLGQVGSDSMLILDSFDWVNHLTTNAPASVFPPQFTFDYIDRSNEHVYGMGVIAKVGGASKLTINKMRGFESGHFAIRSADYTGDEYGGPGEWKPTIRLNNCEFKEMPADPANLQSQLIDNTASISGHSAGVIWRGCSTYAGDIIEDGGKLHAVP